MLLNAVPSDPELRSEIAAFMRTLQDSGWSDGRNVTVDYRWGGGAAIDAPSLRDDARALVGAKPDVMLVTGSALAAAFEVTHEIPIVFVLFADPTPGGFVKSIGRPGGNVTGFTETPSEMGGKWLELIKEIAPKVRRVALFFNSANVYLPQVEAAAASRGMSTTGMRIHSENEIEAAIAAFASEPDGSLIVCPEAFSVVNRDRIVASVAAHALPTSYPNEIFARSGGLLSYGIDRQEQFRQAATYVDRILRGEKPGDLPVQQPTKYRLVINLATAKSLGLEVPIHLQQLADEVIE